MAEACSIEWVTIPAADLPAARLFYEDVFGFEVKEFSERFWVFQAGNLQGGLDGEKSASTSGIGFSITVLDLRKALDHIERCGGKVTQGAYSLGDGLGYCAEFQDPNGNALELYADVLGS